MERVGGRVGVSRAEGREGAVLLGRVRGDRGEAERGRRAAALREHGGDGDVTNREGQGPTLASASMTAAGDPQARAISVGIPTVVAAATAARDKGRNGEAVGSTLGEGSDVRINVRVVGGRGSGGGLVGSFSSSGGGGGHAGDGGLGGGSVGGGGSCRNGSRRPRAGHADRGVIGMGRVAEGRVWVIRRARAAEGEEEVEGLARTLREGELLEGQPPKAETFAQPGVWWCRGELGDAPIEQLPGVEVRGDRAVRGVAIGAGGVVRIRRGVADVGSIVGVGHLPRSGTPIGHEVGSPRRKRGVSSSVGESVGGVPDDVGGHAGEGRAQNFGQEVGAPHRKRGVSSDLGGSVGGVPDIDVAGHAGEGQAQPIGMEGITQGRERAELGGRRGGGRSGDSNLRRRRERGDGRGQRGHNGVEQGGRRRAVCCRG